MMLRRNLLSFFAFLANFMMLPQTIAMDTESVKMGSVRIYVRSINEEVAMAQLRDSVVGSQNINWKKAVAAAKLSKFYVERGYGKNTKPKRQPISVPPQDPRPARITAISKSILDETRGYFLTGVDPALEEIRRIQDYPTTVRLPESTFLFGRLSLKNPEKSVVMVLPLDGVLF